MQKSLSILVITALTTAIGTTAWNFGLKNPKTPKTTDSQQTEKVHPIIKRIFYNLPLDKSRLELREVLLNDKRFMLTDTTFNNFKPSTFFKGITKNKGLIASKPDSIQIMLIYGNAALVTEKGGKEDFNKNPMILESDYFFSNKLSAEKEYKKLVDMVSPIYTDTTSIKSDQWETQYSKGTQKCTGKIFDHFDPYYRLAISIISFIPADGSESVFVLNIAFSKEDKK